MLPILQSFHQSLQFFDEKTTGNIIKWFIGFSPGLLKVFNAKIAIISSLNDENLITILDRVVTGIALPECGLSQMFLQGKFVAIDQMYYSKLNCIKN